MEAIEIKNSDPIEIGAARAAIRNLGKAAKILDALLVGGDPFYDGGTVLQDAAHDVAMAARAVADAVERLEAGAPCGYSLSDGDRALRKAMYTVGVTDNAVNRFIADAVAEKLVEMEEGNGKQ